MTLQEIKNRFGIIGSSPLLDRAIDIAQQVSATNMSVLITGESGVGKEVFSKIIHHLSPRKHNNFIAVNCGAIPEGTIDSELFGHEKGSFTGASDARKGYFEVVNGGTIFLDEVADLPLQTQVRLLRVLESGEIIRVGSSKVLKTDVRIVAATNMNMMDAVSSGKFREDLYYRLNTVPIKIPALRERKEDIELLFRKFAADFADKYRMPIVKLNDGAKKLLMEYRWPGNIRQLKNVTEQISVLEYNREINEETLKKYIPDYPQTTLPVLIQKGGGADGAGGESFTDRELLYKFLFDMRKDIVELKKIVMGILAEGAGNFRMNENNSQLLHNLYQDVDDVPAADFVPSTSSMISSEPAHEIHKTHEVEESLVLQDREMELITKALQKHRGKRKSAAKELGISERTLYRKIREYSIKE